MNLRRDHFLGVLKIFRENFLTEQQCVTVLLFIFKADVAVFELLFP